MALYNLASTYQDLKCHHEAVPIYEKLLLIQPDHNDAWFNLGLSYEWLTSFGSPNRKYSVYASKAQNCYENITKDFVYYDEVCQRISYLNSINEAIEDQLTF